MRKPRLPAEARMVTEGELAEQDPLLKALAGRVRRIWAAARDWFRPRVVLGIDLAHGRDSSAIVRGYRKADGTVVITSITRGR